MKNELQVFLFRLCYDASAIIGYVEFSHLDVISAKMGLIPCRFNPFIVLKTKATRCPLGQTKCKSDEISVQLTIFNNCVLYIW